MARKRQPSAPSAEEMLRWLQRSVAVVEPPSGSGVWEVRSFWGLWFYGPTLRAAIRAAMRAEKGGRRG